MNKCGVLITAMLLFLSRAWAGGDQHLFYRTFWHPVLHDVRLAWCYDGGKECGLSTATQYCKLMGYKKAVNSIKANDIGESRYLANGKICRGWHCDGFKKIKCIDTQSHSPPKSYYYRKRVFTYPRFEHQRVAWCYNNNSGCGWKVAQSFCRRMGYMRTVGYEKQISTYATEQIGSKKLCYGMKCPGFSTISCYR